MKRPAVDLSRALPYPRILGEQSVSEQLRDVLTAINAAIQMVELPKPSVWRRLFAWPPAESPQFVTFRLTDLASLRDKLQFALDKMALQDQAKGTGK